MAGLKREEKDEPKAEAPAFKIEKGVDMPPILRRTATPYPFDSMGVGDSFLVACEPERRKTVQNTLNGAARRYSKREGGNTTFSTRRVDDGVRIWRTA